MKDLKRIVVHKELFLKGGFYAFIISSLLTGSCTQRIDKNNSFVFGDSLFLKNIPSQPEENTWKFIEDLKSPMWTHHAWEKAEPGPRQADLSGGVKLQMGFPDPKLRLETCYEDLRQFFVAGDVGCDNGKYFVETIESKELKGESFRVEVKPDRCLIVAGDADGIRRGVFCIEDEMLRLRGPFLPLGTIEKSAVIQRRISRCFFGPIKRFPKMRDELMDDVDYYPDQYLNRLAHEGVNGLWLTVEFRDLVSTTWTPDAGKNGVKRLAKLRQTVEKCLRYGIKTYIFCIEPRAWDPDNPVIKNYPELAGAPTGKGHFFCPMSKTAHNYLYESVNKIFKAVPELGGMINITHGERGTTCLSSVSCTSDYEHNINCPRCSNKEPWEILSASLSAMEQGMHDAAPDAELISWLYMPQPQRFVAGDSYKLGDWVYDLPAHTPERVILQFNFESGITGTEFGKFLVGGDYWISKPGPSERFERIANIARKKGTKVSAKIQTGNSHEVATTPFVPVPSLLYRKFSAMRDLGVSHTMLCWYFGNYPGLMNKAAGLLSVEPFPENEDIFLHQLASIDWKEEDVPKVVEAWKLFSKGYENYPLTNLFQYYGPIHDGPVWPLLLKPADAPLSPTWQIGSSSTLKSWPPSGDRVGECIGDVLTLEEVTELTHRMTTSWEKGMAILAGLQNKYTNETERLLDIGVAQALGIQLRSGYNILHFYLLREKMFRMEGKERFNILNQLTSIIREELTLDGQLLKLCEKDSRLGFHSEAEGYKYYPEKIKWRMGQLKSIIENDVPELKRIIRNNKPLFPEYTGKKPDGPITECITYDKPVWSENGFVLPENLKWQSFNYGSDMTNLQWASAYSKDALYLFVAEKEAKNILSKESSFASLEVKIEPQRLYPAGHFVFNTGDINYNGDPVHIIGYPLLYRGGLRETNDNGKWYAAVRIPFKHIGLNRENMDPIRMDLVIRNRQGKESSWRPNNPTTSRLILGSDNPADLGWLVFSR
ncbi:MAG: hypothetical protein LLG13_04445 [Bacteroidales bacterium]|nr:hypothetical protein [Bacteroidales bacterium]